MPRSGKDARRRLREAALELFRERGYDATTAAEIAARAGVTERTFFRHFPDKREALFDGEEAFRAALTAGVLGAPGAAGPVEALIHAFRSVEPMILENRSFSQPREAVIARSPALQERVLTKAAGLAAALALALRQRGVDQAVAQLAAEIGMAAFAYAARRWSEDPEGGLGPHLIHAFDAVGELCSAAETGSPASPSP